jgi:hypothetical protein
LVHYDPQMLFRLKHCGLSSIVALMVLVEQPSPCFLLSSLESFIGTPLIFMLNIIGFLHIQ